MSRSRALVSTALDALGALGALAAVALVVAPLLRAGVSPLTAPPEVLVGVYGPSWLLALAPLAVSAWALTSARPAPAAG